MAVIDQSTYSPLPFFKSSHFNTVYRTLFHNLTVTYDRQRLETSDGDFMDLDFSRVGSGKLLLILHGLEGSSHSKYVLSLTKIANENGFDVAAVNLRGCSGETNRKLYSYHSGKTDDLAEVLNFAEKLESYDSFYIVGYSLGGNLLLKYLGESRSDYPEKLKSGIGVSVPCDLKGSSQAIARFSNMVYMKRFLISLKNKTTSKLEQFPKAALNWEAALNSRDFFDFDNHFTAPVNGFLDAFDYYEKNSSKQFLEDIRLPSLLITAADDPFLSESCIPVKEAKANDNFYLELTPYGGHVGYNLNFEKGSGFWLERRIMDFFKDVG